MNPVKFRQTGRNSKAPMMMTGNSGWYLFPSFEEDHLIVRPGDTVTVGCGAELLCEQGCVLTLYTCPGSTSPLMIHPAFISGGEAVCCRVTNASRSVCVIAKNDFDFSAKSGHGIFRSAFVIPYDDPMAFGIPTACALTDLTSLPDHAPVTGAEGMCAL